jgi:hypothetical protein
MNGDKAQTWRTSSYSANSGNCIEVSVRERVVAVRDSKQGGAGPVLETTAAAWRDFLTTFSERGRDL